jgi:hypothetical protein
MMTATKSTVNSKKIENQKRLGWQHTSSLPLRLPSLRCRYDIVNAARLERPLRKREAKAIRIGNRELARVPRLILRLRDNLRPVAARSLSNLVYGAAADTEGKDRAPAFRSARSSRLRSQEQIRVLSPP